jgi:hypothetical protein
MRRTSERVTGDVDMWYVSEHGGKNPGTRCMGERVTKDFDMYVIEQEGKTPETRCMIERVTEGLDRTG